MCRRHWLIESLSIAYCFQEGNRKCFVYTVNLYRLIMSKISTRLAFTCKLCVREDFCHSSLHHWIYSTQIPINEHNALMLALLIHVHVGHELEAFSPQTNESQTTASKNEIDDSVEFASAVKTQQCTNECKTNRKECLLTLLCLLLQTQVRNLHWHR